MSYQRRNIQGIIDMCEKRSIFIIIILLLYIIILLYSYLPINRFFKETIQSPTLALWQQKKNPQSNSPTKSMKQILYLRHTYFSFTSKASPSLSLSSSDFSPLSIGWEIISSEVRFDKLWRWHQRFTILKFNHIWIHQNRKH